ncbi:hypothetical protein [Lactococcus petauri]|uniref:hypothetical protein n=1 Tax=Lactococcus petauri TaxID=1940789 RepID=UPI0018A95858|nr:hypothetical protein [Lactococcus petauri]
MLEANIYDNFNPNELNVFDFELPGGAGKVTRPIPKPKSRTQVLEYELWETGYKYSSSALLASEVEVGDIVEVLYPKKVPIATSATTSEQAPLSFIYLVIDVDDDNRATLQNYFWAMIEGNELPTKSGNQLMGGILTRAIDPNINQLMTHGFSYNPLVFTGNIKLNRKSDTTETSGVVKDIFSKTQFQPTAMIRTAVYDINGELSQPRDTIQINLASRFWQRSMIETKIDIGQNPATETETIVERSNYNFLISYVKTDPEGDTYKETPDLWTVDDDGNVINYRTYQGDGYNLPQQKIPKTMFFDEAPTAAQIKAEITSSTIVKLIYFNVDPKLELYTNDLVKIWYNGISYSGHIADRVVTPVTNRLLFVEGTE